MGRECLGATHAGCRYTDFGTAIKILHGSWNLDRKHIIVVVWNSIEFSFDVVHYFI